MSDEQHYIADLAREILAAPQPIAGLAPQQSRLVRILSLRPEHWHPANTLAAAVAHRSDDPPLPGIIGALVYAIRKRRPDIRIETACGFGYRVMEAVER